MINDYDSAGRVGQRHLPPRYFKLSYLVTAWTQRPEDEHRLLSAILACFLRYDAIPATARGELAELALPVAITVGLPPPEDRGFADVWSALGGELKPSLDVVASVPVDAGQRQPVGPLVTQPVTVRARGRAPWQVMEIRQGRPRADAGRPVTGIGLGYLSGRVGLVEGRVRDLIARRRLDDPNPDDPFRGLYLTDEAVDRLLEPLVRRHRQPATERSMPNRPATPPSATASPYGCGSWPGPRA